MRKDRISSFQKGKSGACAAQVPPAMRGVPTGFGFFLPAPAGSHRGPVVANALAVEAVPLARTAALGALVMEAADARLDARVAEVASAALEVGAVLALEDAPAGAAGHNAVGPVAGGSDQPGDAAARRRPAAGLSCSAAGRIWVVPDLVTDESGQLGTAAAVGSPAVSPSLSAADHTSGVPRRVAAEPPAGESLGSAAALPEAGHQRTE